MRYLKSFNESHQYPTDHMTVVRLLYDCVTAPYGTMGESADNHNIMNRIQIDPDGTVNVIRGSIRIESKNWKGDQGRLPIKFGWVEDEFAIAPWVPLTTLEGSPHTCTKFVATGTNIKNLVGGPTTVHGSYNVSSCPLTSLEGAPEEVGGYFDCESSKITSLAGGPRKVGGYFDCSATRIIDLIGGPEFVGDQYSCASNSLLTSLDGAPKSAKSLRISDSEIWDPRPLKGCQFELINFDIFLRSKPEHRIRFLFEVFDRGNIFERGNKQEATKNFLDSLDYNYIRGTSENPKINLFRFREVFEELGFRPYGLIALQKHYTFVDDDGNPIKDINEF